MYDVICDVHGYAQLLKKLLLKLGYRKTSDGYAHPGRKAVFVGDFMNRGPRIRKSLKIIRSMVENGNALAILGNHELSALIVDVRSKNSPVVNVRQKNDLSVYKTLNEFALRKEEWKSHMKWMRTLPFFLETDHLRFVHACWSDDAVNYLKNALSPGMNGMPPFFPAPAC